jgi:plastocyanin
MKKVFLISMLLLAGFILAACGGGGDAGSGDVVMDEPVPAGAENATVVELEFTADEIIPNTVSIPAGQEVLFVIYNSDTNEGDLNEDHNLVAPDIGLKEMIVVPGQTIRRLWTAYDEPGEYRVGCTIHPWIDMTLVIE